MKAIHFISGTPRSGSTLLSALLRQNPGYAPAHYGLAVLYDDDHGDRRRAADHYRRYLALAPQAADADQVRQWLRQAEQADKKQ